MVGSSSTLTSLNTSLNNNNNNNNSLNHLIKVERVEPNNLASTTTTIPNANSNSNPSSTLNLNVNNVHPPGVGGGGQVILTNNPNNNTNTTSSFVNIGSQQQQQSVVVATAGTAQATLNTPTGLINVMKKAPVSGSPQIGHITTGIGGQKYAMILNPGTSPGTLLNSTNTNTPNIRGTIGTASSVGPTIGAITTANLTRAGHPSLLQVQQVRYVPYHPPPSSHSQQQQRSFQLQQQTFTTLPRQQQLPIQQQQQQQSTASHIVYNNYRYQRQPATTTITTVPQSTATGITPQTPRSNLNYLTNDISLQEQFLQYNRMYPLDNPNQNANINNNNNNNNNKVQINYYQVPSRNININVNKISNNFYGPVQETTALGIVPSLSLKRKFEPQQIILIDADADAAEEKRRRMMTGCVSVQRQQITLQALSGLQPATGATAVSGLSGGTTPSGHHLLVKTENGQYQLLRFTAAANAAAAAASANNNANTQNSSQTPSVNTTTSGQAVIVSNHQQIKGNASPAIQTIRLQSIVTHGQTMTTTTTSSPTIVNNFSSNNSGVGHFSNSPMTMGMVPQMIQQQQSPILQQQQNTFFSNTSIPSTVAAGSNITSTTTANTVNQMSAETAKMKCKNFLSFLLELSAKQNATVARNVKNLIQGLVDGKVNEVDFSDRLQKEVNSQPQPCLVGFLKKSLPHLRHSLATKELTIDGIRPPSLSSVVVQVPVTSNAPVTALIPQNQVRSQGTPVRIITPISGGGIIKQATPTNSSRSSAIAAVQNRFANSNSANQSTNSSSTPTHTTPKSKGSASKGKNATSASPSTSSSNQTKGSASSAKSNISGKDSKDPLKNNLNKSFTTPLTASSAAYGGDDDINDVAAMGGVNLAEESQRILGSTEFVGTQIRSCPRDEDNFLQVIPLQSKIKEIASKYGLSHSSQTDTSSDTSSNLAEVALLISQATEERIKTLIEKLSIIAEHRMDLLKMDDRYEITQDVKGQIRFLDDLDKLEKKRHDEQEREMLIRAAKSRSKSEDPEQAKLKAKAKEMQRVALEELRQKEANLTALQAIGPRKKPKLDGGSGGSSNNTSNSLNGSGSSLPNGGHSSNSGGGSHSLYNNSNSAGGGGMFGASSNRPQRPRLKRVNLRDFLFLMEQEKDTMRSHFLYKNMLLK